MTFADFFQAATGNAPYGYQCRLACGDAAAPARPDTLTTGTDCTSRLISIPTGLGKTAAVILAWLWNRVALGKEDWPRRLVYCLPMRTLVEQTRDEIGLWLDALAKKYPDNPDFAWLACRSPIILMGGEENDAARRQWDIYPEKPAILIGTQDMLLSRALNRGYGMSRARWPMHFALLNNDALWVADETQLMDVGLATSSQLQSFRNDDQHKNFYAAHTWWMSATLQPGWLKTPESALYLPALQEAMLETSAQDRFGPLWDGVEKTLHLAGPLAEKQLAAFAMEQSDDAQTTLIIVNTVKRAVAVYDALAKNKQVQTNRDIHLVHSRFRPCDRAKWRGSFLRRHAPVNKARIIVATQVVEAGVDISADVLLTDLAPWTSLVQRFGRAARYGGRAHIYVVDVEEKKAAPYDYAELEAAATALKNLADVSIQSLENFEQSLAAEQKRELYPYAPLFLLLRQELEELFDTSADLSGADLDISRFIRSGEENDCQIAWVQLEKDETPPARLQPSREELCSISIADARKFIKTKKGMLWKWDYLDKSWIPANEAEVYPGLILLADARAGSYDSVRGFDPAIKKPVPCPAVQLQLSPLTAADAAEEDESLSETKGWQSIAEHGHRAADILQAIHIAPPALASLLDAVLRWHDLGKAHPAFVSIIRPDAPGHPGGSIAKAPQAAWIRPPRYQISDADQRPGFRHELASILALIDLLQQCAPNHPALLGPWANYVQNGQTASPEQTAQVGQTTPIQSYLLQLAAEEFNLLLYLIASHHGKVRVCMQASPADQRHPVAKTGSTMPIRGIIAGDTVPALQLTMADGSLTPLPETRLGLEPAKIGLSAQTGASWSERCTTLLIQYGPFALAWLETLIRAADTRASMEEEQA
ncbi:MAG: CRISPR-associated helicase Cas3' [bacterium]|nr:CRISPR-associated helicase Cas3' [bacterium]